MERGPQRDQEPVELSVYSVEIHPCELRFIHHGTGRVYVSNNWLLMREALLLAAKIYLGGADECRHE